MSSEYNLNLGDDDQESKPRSAWNKFVDVIYMIPRKARIVLSIILIAAICITALNVFKPEARKRAIPETVVRVDVIEAQRSSYPIIVNANGTVEAETRGNLVAQIRGEIVAVSNNFNTGGSFKKGDLLIQLDQRDYQAELSRALANLSQAEAAYFQEQATAKQAKLDWQRLGNTSPAPDLVLRKPQLTAAKAQFDSAKAAHDTAKLNLSRTAITAPYDGRIIERRAVLGQYVSIGTPIAEVFATDGVEVRLPISQDEFSQLGLDSFSSGNDSNQYAVSLTTRVGNQDYQWDAAIARTDSTFDINTRQIDVIADVADPFGKTSGQPALKIGQFVTARIQGRSVDGVFVIPNKSIREGSYIYAVRDGKLAKQSINIIWQDDQNALIASGIQDGELVVTTSLNSTLAGASAKLTDTATSEEAATAQGADTAPVEETAQSPNKAQSEETAESQETAEEDQGPLESATEEAADTSETATDQATDDAELAPEADEVQKTVIEAVDLSEQTESNSATPAASN